MRSRVSAGSAAALQRRQAALRANNSGGGAHGHANQGSSCATSSGNGGSGGSGAWSSPPAAAVVCAHYFPSPNLSVDPELVFELIVFAYSIVAMALQLLHLYRSVFWLPHSYNDNAVNWHLIEWHLLTFAAVFLGRRLLWTILRTIVSKLTPQRWTASFVVVARSLLTLFIPLSLFFLIYFKMRDYPMINLLYLAYPVAVYFCLFGLAAEPFLELIPTTALGKMKLQRDKNGNYRPIYTSSLHGHHHHSSASLSSASSSPSPESVRQESRLLRADFNGRMRQVAFNSICSAYYTTFVPCAFAQSYVHYDRSWVGRHVLLVWVGCFSLYVAQCFPGKYVHALHRCATYLGRWIRLDGGGGAQQSHLRGLVGVGFHSAWSAEAFWSRGAVVRHGKGLYRAEGVANAAEPDDAGQGRFYGLFQDVSLFSWIAVIFQSGLCLAQHVSLSWSSQWYMLLSESILLFANYYALFKLMRDYLVFMRINVSEEELIQKLDGKN